MESNTPFSITKHFSSVEETEQFAQAFAAILKEGDLLLLTGKIGAGKTTFLKALAKSLGITENVTSPTFALCHTYEARKTVYHYDLYRLSGYDDLYSIGFFDRPHGTVALIEWSENAEEYLPEDALRIYFEYGSGETERILQWEDAT